MTKDKTFKLTNADEIIVIKESKSISWICDICLIHEKRFLMYSTWLGGCYRKQCHIVRSCLASAIVHFNPLRCGVGQITCAKASPQPLFAARVMIYILLFNKQQSDWGERLLGHIWVSLFCSLLRNSSAVHDFGLAFTWVEGICAFCTHLIYMFCLQDFFCLWSSNLFFPSQWASALVTILIHTLSHFSFYEKWIVKCVTKISAQWENFLLLHFLDHL